MTDKIERTLEFKASVERVWQAITRAEELSAWFPNKSASFEATEGFVGWFEWDLEACTGRYAVRVEKVEEQRYIAWRWAREADTPIDEAYTTLVEWTLEPLSNGGTRLHLVESGFENLKDRSANVEGWQEELGELVEYLG